ncbi:hypothetical protein ACFFUA_38090, partial [Streptomyces heliomycini]
MTLIARFFAPVLSLRRILPILWHSSRSWTLLGTALMALEVASGLAVLYLFKQLVDVVTGMLAGEGAEGGAWQVLGFVALTGGCTLIFLASRSMAGLAREAQGMLVADHIDREIHTRAVRADLA